MEKARAADAKETALQRDLEKNDLRDQIDVDLQFAVQICLAQCCHLSGLDQEALSIYSALVKNQYATSHLPSTWADSVPELKDLKIQWTSDLF